MPGEGQSDGGSGIDGGGGGGGEADDISAIIAYLNHIDFGTNGDYTGIAGFGGDNIGPPGSQPPPVDPLVLLTSFGQPTEPPVSRPPGAASRTEGQRIANPYGRVETPPGPLSAFVGWDVDPYTGLSIGDEALDPYFGLPQDRDAFEDAGAIRRSQSASAAYLALLPASLLSSPNLLAQNDVAQRSPDRGRRADTVSDFDPNASLENIDAQMEESYRALARLAANRTTFAVPGTVDVNKLIEAAARQANSPEYKLGYTINQLRTTPVVVERSPVWAGIKQMAWGTVSTVGSGLLIGATDGLALPLVGAMGLSTGVAQFGSGLTLTFSGASTSEIVRYEEGYDYVYSLTVSPTALAMGSLSLPFINGSQEVSHNLALAGGLVENLSLFGRGDPSKLYSSILPGTDTAAQTGGTVLRIQEASALGNRALGVTQLAAKMDEASAVAARIRQVEEWTAARGAPLPIYGDPSDPSSIFVRIGDVEKLGFRGTAGPIDKMTLSRDITTGEKSVVGDLNAAVDRFRQVYRETGRADLAGTEAHAAAGAAGPGQGVDFMSPGGGYIVDLKTHGPWTMMDQRLMDLSSTSSLNYSIKHQIETFIKGGEALTPLRSNIHLYINETDAVLVRTR